MKSPSKIGGGVGRKPTHQSIGGGSFQSKISRPNSVVASRQQNSSVTRANATKEEQMNPYQMKFANTNTAKPPASKIGKIKPRV